MLLSRSTIKGVETSIFLFLSLLIISGCTTTQPASSKSDENSWATRILNYESSLPANHPHRPEHLLQVDDEILALVRSKFSNKVLSGGKHRRAKALTKWLLDENGRNMVYDLDANFSPNRAFSERRGNCLSFTILLVTLANEIDIKLKYNDVDLPGTWDLDERAGLVFYRHINAIFKSNSKKQIFDLAIEDYDAGYPQRIISARSAAALLHSNLGVDALKEKDMDTAFHHFKLAVSINPDNADLWVNLGATYKRNQQLVLAEKAFKYALAQNDDNNLAASNLERLYRDQGRHTLADRFKRLAARARLNNPYVQFRNAQRHYKEKEFKLALRSVKRAIKLHDQDPQFFELSSRVNQHFKRYKRALLDLEKAFNLAKNADERGRYFNKVKMVVQRAEQEALRIKKRTDRLDGPQIVDPQSLRY